MNIPKILVKATLLATCIFWVIIVSENFEDIMIPLIFLSIIPISICCTITIIFTIVPFFWLKNKKISNASIFNKNYPFYTILSFSLCLYFTLKEPSLISFFTSAFFTTMQSWVWFGKVTETK